MNYLYVEDLNINSLSRLFSSTTNSYKYIFFTSLINIINLEDRNGKIPVSIITVDALFYAWKILKYFHLSLGSQDKISDFTERLDALVINELRSNGTDREIKLLIKSNYNEMGLDRLNRYVPFRLLRSFFQKETKGTKDGLVNEMIMRLSNDCFDDKKPLYRITVEDGEFFIQPHPLWFRYLKDNYNVIDAWVKWEFALYLQSRNPNSPAIVSKLSFPVKRQSLSKQANYWKSVMDVKELRCIYTDTVLNGKDFVLDHFVPWSYVCHNQLWNLVPVAPQANLDKSNWLPSSKYVRPFIDFQISGLLCLKNIVSEDEWEKIINPYMIDMNLNNKFSLTDKELRVSYENMLNSMLSLAKQDGFMPGWVCNI